MENKEILKIGSKCEYYIDGMHCPACELAVERKLEELKIIKNVDAVLNSQKVFFDINSRISREELLNKVNQTISPYGYSIGQNRPRHKVNFKDMGIGLAIAAALVGIFFLIQKLGIVDILGGRSMSFGLVFLIGVVASLSSCMAVVGGLVLSISSNYAKGREQVMPLVLFHASRIIGFFLLGGVFGLIGLAFNFTPNFYFIMSIILFLIMIILGINLLDLFPFFRKIQIRMPKRLSKRVTGIENIRNRFTPLLLGIVTFFLPCGFTQSMQINAMTSGNFLNGALIMLIFALGTLPVLAIISFSSVRFANSLRSGIFFKTAGFIVIFFAMLNLLSALVAAGIMYPIF